MDIEQIKTDSGIIRRYKMVHNADPSYRTQMMVRHDGKYVMYDDHEAAVIAQDALIKELVNALEQLESEYNVVSLAHKEPPSLTSAVWEARAIISKSKAAQ